MHCWSSAKTFWSGTADCRTNYGHHGFSRRCPGVITRVVPQLNVFVLGFPIKILMGMLIVILAVPVFISIAAKLFGFDGLLMEVIMGLITSGS